MKDMDAGLLNELQYLSQAAHCPVCEKLPLKSIEEVLDKPLVFLRCPQGHPYVICGDTLLQAINNWNEYIALRIQADSRKMMKAVAKNLNTSYCRHCEKFTPSITHFDKQQPTHNSVGCSIVFHKCAFCLLTKKQQEAA